MNTLQYHYNNTTISQVNQSIPEKGGGGCRCNPSQVKIIITEQGTALKRQLILKGHFVTFDP